MVTPWTDHFCRGVKILQLVRPGAHARPQGLGRMRFINEDLYQGLGLPLGGLGKALSIGGVGGGSSGQRMAEEEPAADRRGSSRGLTVSVASPPEGPC